MAYYKGNAYLERIGVITAYRNPEPRISPGALKAHRLPLYAPKPYYEWQEYLLGDPKGDTGPTLDWPNPAEES